MNPQRPALPRSVLAVLALLGLAACHDDSPGSGAPAATGGVRVASAFPNLSFDNPVFVTHAPGDAQRLFVVTQAGVIHVFPNDSNAAAAKVFLDINDRVTDDGGEQGLLGMAFDPDYASNGFFYLNYNPNFDATPLNPRRTAIARYKVSADPDAADPASETILLEFNQPFPNHKGGWLGFGPDGKLYIATGDGGSANDPANNAQNLNSPLGKILRLNGDGTIPPDNPFAGQPDQRGEIWAYGLRNPFRTSFDRQSGELWAGDVGQNQWEEIDLIVRGGNYGWRKFEGNHDIVPTDPDPGNHIPPVFEYEHTDGRCSIIGGYVYRGGAINGLGGAYLYADYCTGELWTLTRSGSTYTSTALGDVPGNPTSFGEDAAGEIYITSFDGMIYTLAPEG